MSTGDLTMPPAHTVTYNTSLFLRCLMSFVTIVASWKAAELMKSMVFDCFLMVFDGFEGNHDIIGSGG